MAQTSDKSPAPQRKIEHQRGLTLRSVVVCLVAMFVMGIWIEYEELYQTAFGGPLAQNSPPNSAVGVIWVLLVISAVLYKLRSSLRLTTPELVVIYSALVLAAPLMTQGLWGRMFGLLAGIPHHQDFNSYDSLPSMLWPHGNNLCNNGQFQKEMEGFAQVGEGKLQWADAFLKEGARKSPVLSNGGNPKASSAISLTIPRYDRNRNEILVPGENFLFCCLVKADGFTKGSSYFVKMQADSGPSTQILVGTEATRKTFAQPDGFRRIGVNPVNIPSDLRENITLQIGINGEGKLTVQDVQFFNIEAVEGAYSGRNVVREKNLVKLDANERNFTIVRPDNLLSLAGLKYLFTGYIPLDQWIRPAIAWSLLIGALFAGFLGLNVLMRKQWVENERFTFPLTILPKNLFAEEQDGRGVWVRSIFRNRVMWIGFCVVLPLVLLKGINFYFPQVPAPIFDQLNFGSYFTGTLAKTYFKNIGIGIGTGIGLPFCVLAIALLIETDILFSLWASFLIFQLWFVFGKAANFNRFPGYPWDFQQAMGAFIGYALLALFVGRHHLWQVLKQVTGRTRGKDALDESQEVMSYRMALLLLAGSLGGIALWAVWTGMGALAGLLFFGYMLTCGFAASKIRAECGAPFALLTPYKGMQFIGALGGFAIFGSTGMLVASIAAGFMCVICFLLIAPVQVEMMELGRHFRVKPRDVGAGLTLGLLGGLFIGGFVLLCWLYGFGANNMKITWPYEQNWYFTEFRTGQLNADRAFEAGTLHSTPETQPLNFSKNVDAKGLGIGVVITITLAALRSAFMWFPFHPIGYVLASSHFMQSVWFALFIAWLTRLIVFRVGGAQTIRRGLVPFCVGMFLACIASIGIFDLVGICLRLNGVVDIYTKIP